MSVKLTDINIKRINKNIISELVRILILDRMLTSYVFGPLCKGAMFFENDLIRDMLDKTGFFF